MGVPILPLVIQKYYGFKNQVRNAAALFRDVLDRGYSRYPENRSGVYVQFSPNASCGSSEVYIENRATAALYRYVSHHINRTPPHSMLDMDKAMLVQHTATVISTFTLLTGLVVLKSQLALARTLIPPK